MLRAAASSLHAAQQVREAWEEVRRSEADALRELASTLGAHAPACALLKKIDPNAARFVEGLKPVEDDARAAREWAAFQKSWRLRWLACMKQAGKKGRFDLEYRIARDLLLRDPDCKEARSVVGNSDWKGVWLPDHVLQKRRLGLVWDDRAAWVREADVPRLENGELPRSGTWRPADQVLRERANWAEAWDWDWSVWSVRTNLAPESWRLIRDGLDDAEDLFRRRFGHLLRIKPAVKVSMYVFAGQGDYERHVAAAHSGDRALTARPGFFDSKENTLHVVWDASRAAASTWTVVHEATHALLWNSSPIHGGQQVAKREPFSEEAVCVLAEEDSRASELASQAGERGWPALFGDYAASTKRRGVQDLIGTQAFDYSEIAELYCNALALARFCAADPGQRRFEALVTYVQLEAQDRAHPDLFPKLCGTTWEKLEADWNAFLDELVKDPSYGRKPR